MTEFLKMDVFFVVTTGVVIVVGVLVVVVLIKVLSILKHVEDVTKRISEESEQIQKDITNAREKIHRDGFKLRHIIGFFTGLASRHRTKSGSFKK